MRRIGVLALVGFVGIALLPRAAAQDERFAVRFGLLVLEPTSDSVIMGERSELETAFGAQGVFEWYFADRVGLEGSLGWAVDADVESDGDVVAGVTVIPLTVGINVHPVRTNKIDWGIGALAGLVLYGDFEFEDTGSGSTGSIRTEDDTGVGLQTFLDVGFGERGRWGMSFGVKWLSSDLDADGEKVSVDPLIVSVMGKFHF